MAEKDYYKLLGVEKSASKDEIKRAYKKLAKEFHPDLNKSPGATEKFKEINEAAAVLGDDDKRKQYDQFGADAFKYAGGGGGAQGYDFSGFDFSDLGFDRFDFDSIFDTFFSGGMGGRGRSRQSRSNRGRDLLYELSITLEEAASGVKKKIKVTKNETCEDCDGNGGKGESACEVCHGNGVYRETKRTPFGLFQTTTSCRNCSGTGNVFKNVCKSCEGTGRVRSTKTIEVGIPVGIMDGARLRVNGEGEAGYRGGSAGDLYLGVHVEPNNIFEREGDNLIIESEISFVQAALGDKIKIPTIGGEASLKIPAGTQPGTILRMKGEGIRHMNGFGKGDQLIRIKVFIPTNLSKKQEKILKEFESN
jgi:molecular chaperone DnaJ